MAQRPKRRPGEPNPTPGRVANTDWYAGGRGHDHGIGSALSALLDWRKRRKELRARDRDDG